MPIWAIRRQYIVEKFHLAEAHRITKGDNAVIAVINSEIDSNQPDLAGTVTDRFDAGCGATSPDAHGTGMAGAIASHGQSAGGRPASKHHRDLRLRRRRPAQSEHDQTSSKD